jgi:hypothetical protein
LLRKSVKYDRKKFLSTGSRRPRGSKKSSEILNFVSHEKDKSPNATNPIEEKQGLAGLEGLAASKNLRNTKLRIKAANIYGCNLQLQLTRLFHPRLTDSET